MIIAATGHRPGKLPCGYDENHPWLTKLLSELEDWLKQKKPTTCISGVALGWDIWFAETALKLNIPLHSYVACPDTGVKWSHQDRARLNNVLSQSTKIEMCSPEYYQMCFLKRDRMMVDSADEIAALLCPLVNHGGTLYTVRYAEKKKKPITNFWRD